MTTKTKEKTKTETLAKVAPPWNVIVWDDPISLMTYVTKVFMKVFGYPQSKAERLMLEVHTTGRSVVWTGGREQAEVYVSKLQAYYLRTTLEQTDG
jgi:ATP-dependent Clp protease adaptor protein ClpS